jgi:mannose-6-phosphate isomerase-like protein (cupin superfamily)
MYKILIISDTGVQMLLYFAERCKTHMDNVEYIDWNNKPLATIVRVEMNPAETTFLTPPEFNLQVGFVVYPGAGVIARHVHLPIERTVEGTSEVLVVKQGRCLVDVYNDHRELVATRELRAGDIIIMVGGGHGFRMLEDTVFLEIKQGPYTGLDEKERF